MSWGDLYIQPRRRGQSIWAWQAKLYVPMPLRLKCEVLRLARESGANQAWLGLVIVQAALADKPWLATVLRAAGLTFIDEAREGETDMEGQRQKLLPELEQDRRSAVMTYRLSPRDLEAVRRFAESEGKSAATFVNNLVRAEVARRLGGRKDAI